jgi:hypothetical protein
VPRRRAKPSTILNPARSRVAHRLRSLTAAGARIKSKDADTVRRLIQPWQSRAYAYYDLLGEIKYAAQFYSRALSQLELYAAELNDEGEIVRTENPEVVDMLDRVQDPGGGRAAMLASYGRIMFLAGEAYLLCTQDTENDVEQWEMLSTDELRVTGVNTIVRYKAPSLMAEDIKEPADDDWEPMGDNEGIVYRIWKRHPRYSMLSDSTMQGVLDLCEELVLLTQAVRARARSRLAGPGVLFMADSFSPPPVDMNAPDDDAAEDPFLAAFTEAAMTPIQDEGSASAVVPLIIRGPLEAIEKGVKHVQIIDPTQLYPETGLRYETIKRLAIGLDMPPEILMGLQDSNHWTAWQIDEQTWKGHLQPIAQQLVDDLTAAFFRPSLKAAGITDWKKYSIAFDATAIINHPDRTKDAKDLYDAVAIGKTALREAAGFDEDDAPTEEERAERIGILTRDSSLAWYGIPKVTTGGVEEAPGQLVTPAGEVGTPGASGGSEVEPGPPPSEQPTAPPEETVIGAARIEGALDLAILRAREAAGSKLRSRARRVDRGEGDEDLAELLRATPPGRCAAVLGPERLRVVSPSGELELVEGARGLITDSLRMFGITDEQKAKEVCDRVLVVAARTLYEESGARTPASLVNYVVGLYGGNGNGRNGRH